MQHLAVENATYDGPERPLLTESAAALVECKKARPAHAGQASAMYFFINTSCPDFPGELPGNGRRLFWARLHGWLRSVCRTLRTSTAAPPLNGDETDSVRCWHKYACTAGTSHANPNGNFQIHSRICMSPCSLPFTARRPSGWTCTCRPCRSRTPTARHGRPPCRYGSKWFAHR